METSPVIVWFRQDLRLSDNPALFYAIQTKSPIVFIYIHDESQHEWQMGAASKWYLRQSLRKLQIELATRFQATLILQKGSPQDILCWLADKISAKAIYWNRLYEPFNIERDKKIKQQFENTSIQIFSYNGALLKEPWEIATLSKEPFKVFTPFWKKLNTLAMRPVFNTPKKCNAHSFSDTIAIDSLLPLPAVEWYQGMAQKWIAGEQEAKNKLAHFLKHSIQEYQTLRNRPDLPYTSELSPYLHFGEISPIQIWHAAKAKSDQCPNLASQLQCFLSELAWREFSYHLLYYYPQLPDKPIKEKFAFYPWKKKKALLTQWQKGLTGYPIVDAGMRQLWHTGWMHNRVRMVVASFLIKHLNQPWQLGEKWFWDTLVDADLANNAASWQWVAGSGMDAAPFFRIFNPILQGEKFDPNGEYVKKWVPELAKLDLAYLHKPWQAPQEILKKANITLGTSYPHPLVDHQSARLQALTAYKKI